MATGKPILSRGALFFAILVLGCSVDVDPSVTRASLATDDIVMTYYEESASMDIVVNLDRFTEHAPPFTLAMQVDVTIPDGTTTRHELGWTHGDDPRIEMPVIGNGLYEVALTNLSIDGHAVGGPIVHQQMEIRGVRSGSELAAECGPGDILEGSVGPDSLEGTAGRDTLFGYEGDDSLFGKECGDILHGGPGNDGLWGNEGNDVLLGGDGNDICTGGPGLDTFGGCEMVTQD